MSDDPRLIEWNDGVLHLRGIFDDDPDSDPYPFLTAGITSKGKFILAMQIGGKWVRVYQRKL